jgi:hypothetical protein
VRRESETNVCDVRLHTRCVMLQASLTHLLSHPYSACRQIAGSPPQYSRQHACTRHDSLLPLLEHSHLGPPVPEDPNVAMGVDPLSPIAGARIRALLLPIGRIKRSRFLKFVELLQQQSLVRLGDISPDPRPDRSTDPRAKLAGSHLLILAWHRYVLSVGVS